MAATDAQLKASTHALSKTWAVARQHKACFTGGKLQVAGAGLVAAQCNDGVTLMSLDTGLVSKIVQHAVSPEHREVITAFALRPGKDEVVTASQNQLLRHWVLESGECKRAWKAHKTPVLSMDFDPTGTLVATGSSDRAVMVWDVDKGYCTHSFRQHSGIVTTVKFHFAPRKLLLVSLCSGNEVRVWDLVHKDHSKHLKNHMGAVTGASFAPDGVTLVTGARDKVLSFWDLESGRLLLTLPVYEELETVEHLPAELCQKFLAYRTSRHKLAGVTFPELRREIAANASFLVTGGNRGTVRMWAWWRLDATRVYCACVATADVIGVAHMDVTGTSDTESKEQDGNPTWARIKSLLWNAEHNSLMVVTADHTIALVDVLTMSRRKQLIGFNDEIIDVAYAPVPLTDKEANTKLPSRVVVATNSEQLRVFDLEGFGVTSFVGHSAVVLCVSCSPDGRFVASGSKDRSVRIWRVSDGACVAVCDGHTDAVGAVAWPLRGPAFAALASPWVASSSKDKTLKLWNMKACLQKDDSEAIPIPSRPSTLVAVKAHDKDINCLAVSPNDALIASASQDKSIKLWSSSDLALKAVLRGHRRGVWAVEFSLVDKVLASASGDRTVRLWSVTTHTCVKVFEGHSSSVLRVRFVRAGMQLLSAGADGLVKLWSVKDNLCVNTFDEHEDRVWAVAVRRARNGTGDDEMVTGGSDSALNVWTDTTAEEAEVAMAETEAKLLKQQDLYNAMALRDYSKAVRLCIELEQPKRLRLILEELLTTGPIPVATMAQKRQAVVTELDELDVCDEPVAPHETLRFSSAAGEELFASVLGRLSPDMLTRLLRYVREWNTTARTSLVANQVFQQVLRHVHADRLTAVAEAKELFAHMAPYADRHFERLDRSLQDTFLLQYTLASMTSLAPDDFGTTMADEGAQESKGVDAVVPKKRPRAPSMETADDAADADTGADADVDMDAAGAGNSGDVELDGAEDTAATPIAKKAVTAAKSSRKRRRRKKKKKTSV